LTKKIVNSIQTFINQLAKKESTLINIFKMLYYFFKTRDNHVVVTIIKE